MQNSPHNRKSRIPAGLPKALLLISVIFWGGCVKYSFKGSLPSTIETIAIPLFQDRSREIGLLDKVYQATVNAFLSDNTLRVVEDPENADLVLQGTIQGVSEQRTAVNQQITVEEYRLQVTLNMECIRTDLDKPLWKGAVSDYGSLPGTGDLAAREAALDEAVEKIVQEIITRTVAAW